MPNVKSIERPQGAVAPLESESAVPPTITLPANQGSVDGPLSRVAASRLVVGKAPALGALPIESIIGIDDRVRIFDTDLAPWRMICSLQMTAPFGSFIGTGWFVGPKTIITAGHCVYHREFMGGWATKIIAIPGRDDSREPFGRVESTRLLTNDRWESDQDPDFDIGCIQLDTPLGDQTGWFGVLSTDDAALQRFLINVAGYPGDPEVGRNGRFLLHDRRMITAVTSRRIFYNADSTAGESGGPAWIYETPDGPPLAVGVHAYGIGGTPSNLNITANSAPRIIPEVAELIRGWIQANP